MEKFKDLKMSIKRWNKESFGDIRELKQVTLVEIERLDKKEEAANLNENEILERRMLRNKLKELIFKEAVAWKQK